MTIPPSFVDPQASVKDSFNVELESVGSEEEDFSVEGSEDVGRISEECSVVDLSSTIVLDSELVES